MAFRPNPLAHPERQRARNRHRSRARWQVPRPTPTSVPRVGHQKQAGRARSDEITKHRHIRHRSWHVYHNTVYSGTQMPMPIVAATRFKMALLLSHTVPRTAAVASCIYVIMGGGADGRTPPEARTPVPPPGPAVARPVDPHPDPAPKPGSRGTPHHTRCRLTGGTRPPSLQHPLAPRGRMTTPTFPLPAAGLSARGRRHASRTHRSEMPRHVPFVIDTRRSL